MLAMDMTVFEILLSLSRGERSTSRILEDLAASGGRTPSLTSFYRKLRRAHEVGWLEIRSVSTAAMGRPPQTYRITAAGTNAFRVEARRLRTLVTLALSGSAPEPDH